MKIFIQENVFENVIHKTAAFVSVSMCHYLYNQAGQSNGFSWKKSPVLLIKFQ